MKRKIAATNFPISEPQATISTDPALTANRFEMDVKEGEVAPIADGIESESLPERSAPLTLQYCLQQNKKNRQGVWIQKPPHGE